MSLVQKITRTFPSLWKKTTETIGLAIVLATFTCGDNSEENLTLEEMCHSDNDCPEEEICENNVCLDRQENIIIGDAEVSLRRADSGGIVRFGTITAELRDERGQIIHNPSAAQALYFNHLGFDCFVVDHPDYVHAPQCFNFYAFKSNNDSIALSLTPAPLQLFRPDTDREENTLERFSNFLQENGRYQGCWGRNQIVDRMQGNSFLIQTAINTFSGGLAAEIANQIINYITEELTIGWDENDVADIYVLIPREYGFAWSTTTITTLEVRERRAGENCGSNEHCSSDDDCSSSYNCRTATGECEREPGPLCTGADCLDIRIRVYDSGSEGDDSFGLEIVGGFYGETPSGGSRIWTVPMERNQEYEMVLYGISVPDGIGTYTIELTNASVIDGPPLSGDDLDNGMRFTWQIRTED